MIARIALLLGSVAKWGWVRLAQLTDPVTVPCVAVSGERIRRET